MKLYRLIPALLVPFAWGVDEVNTYAEGRAQAREDGWVLLCYSGDWDTTHDEGWMRRQTAISSACGNAHVLYVPVYQNPTAEQAEQLTNQLAGSSVNLDTLPSVPCAILLDADGRPYTTISGDDFRENAAGKIRQAQTLLRTRINLQRQAAYEEGSDRAQTLSRIWRLSITPPPNLLEQIREADPQDSARLAEWASFNPWELAGRIHSMPWQEAIAELDRVEQVPLSKEERQAVLAIRMGCVHHHLGAAGAKDIRRMAAECTALAPGSPLGKAAQRAAELWGEGLQIDRGWAPGQLPRVAADCEVAVHHGFVLGGEYRITFLATGGKDPVRITGVTLYDDNTKIAEDIHSCALLPGGAQPDNEYMLILPKTPTRPRLVISFDQQGMTDTQGTLSVRRFSMHGEDEEEVREKAWKVMEEEKKHLDAGTLQEDKTASTPPEREVEAPIPTTDEGLTGTAITITESNIPITLPTGGMQAPAGTAPEADMRHIGEGASTLPDGLPSGL